MAVAILGAMSGGGGMSGSVSRTNVTVDPVAYEAVTKKTAGAFFEMVAASAKGS